VQNRIHVAIYYALPLIGGALSDDAVWRLSVAYVGPKARTERLRKTKTGTEVAHVSRDSDTTFKVKGQGHQAALLTAAFTHQAAAAVSVGTYSPWEPTATLRSGTVSSAVRGASAPTEGGEGQGHIVAAPAQLVSFKNFKVICLVATVALMTITVGIHTTSKASRNSME